MTILALDLGTKTGVARGDVGARPVLETWTMPSGGGEVVGPFMRTFMDHLEAALDGVKVVIFEEPFVAVRENQQGRPYLQLDQIRRAYGMAAIVEGMAERAGAECFGVVTVSLKKDFTGNGRAEKHHMMRMARTLGFDPQTDHEADALAAWLFVLRRKHPLDAHRFDQLFVRARGAE